VSTNANNNDKEKGSNHRMIKILIADDHPLYREALVAALQQRLKSVKFLESDSLDSVLVTAKKHRNLSLVLLDLNMPGCDNFYGLLKLSECCPELPIAIISAHDSPSIVSQSLAYGAKAFIPKTTTTDDLIVIIESLLAGKDCAVTDASNQETNIEQDTLEVAKLISGLTPKQFKVLSLVRKGLMNKEIAAQLKVTEATVKAHIGAIFKQLNVKSRTQILVKIEKVQLD
jgi:DNA-binding NarL/FixJ family response regulator